MLVTKNELLDIAVGAENIMSFEQRPSGTPQSTAWINARLLQQQALSAAAWMEEEGVEETPQIGPFGRLDIKSGDKVRIKKGAVILSMNPKFTRDNPKVAKKDYVVQVTSVSEGWISPHWHPNRRNSSEVHREQSISWPGEGGYWCYLDTAMVEVID